MEQKEKVKQEIEEIKFLLEGGIDFYSLEELKEELSKYSKESIRALYRQYRLKEEVCVNMLKEIRIKIAIIGTQIG